MRVKGIFVVGIALLGLAASMVSPNSATGAVLDPSLCAPDQNSFTLSIDNPYFPLQVGQQWILVGEDEGESKGLRITVLNETADFYGGALTTRVVQELEWLDTNANGRVDRGEELVEVSHNYFAQTQDGTVCYFGEVVDIYEGGVVVSHEGAWRADDSGNAPGIFMPASAKSGMEFQQEFAPGIAEDRAKIVGTGAVTVPAGTFTETIRARETNPLDGDVGYKYYAEGIGLIIDGPLQLISSKN